MSDWIADTLAGAESIAKAREDFDALIDRMEAAGMQPTEIVQTHTHFVTARLEGIGRYLTWVNEYAERNGVGE
jgi:hypothetical protein